MLLVIQLPKDVEEFYAAEADAKGLPLDRHIVERLVASARFPRPQQQNAKRPLNLPLLRGSVTGHLRRQDIYDDRA